MVPSGDHWKCLETETVFAKHQRPSDMLPTRTYSQYKHVPPNDFQLNNRPHTANTAVVPLKRMTLCTVVILTCVILTQWQCQDYTIYSFTELYLTEMTNYRWGKICHTSLQIMPHCPIDSIYNLPRDDEELPWCAWEGLPRSSWAFSTTVREETPSHRLRARRWVREMESAAQPQQLIFLYFLGH